ncbi:hypothetical protein HOY82DRAFT_554330, partial [Tuber indicum]
MLFWNSKLSNRPFFLLLFYLAACNTEVQDSGYRIFFSSLLPIFLLGIERSHTPCYKHNRRIQTHALSCDNIEGQTRIPETRKGGRKI